MPSDRSVGLIPACAGKTLNNADQVANVRAHPRVCGENLSAECGLSGSEGSSPRVRGKLRWAIGVGWADRAHPRVCGENLRPLGPKETFHGSSPRVRGKPAASGTERNVSRLIPACAGKTWHVHEEPRGRPAHPRVCGENEASRYTSGLFAGSSPRVRGKQQRARAKGEQSRLIPACAGKTSHSLRAAGSDPAHPRVCGENKSIRLVNTPVGGSSPRVRGKRDLIIREICSSGLIPACAGKTPRLGVGRF